MNFNITKTKDYTFQKNVTNELISLYGIKAKLLIVEKVNLDTTVFGDYSHIKTDNTKTFEIDILPENSEGFDADINYSAFGMSNSEVLSCFISRTSIELIFANFDLSRGLNGILGNLIVLPSNKLMEITDLEFMTPGVSNSFTANDIKNVYRLSMSTFKASIVNEITSTDIVQSTQVTDANTDYTVLDNYFNELTTEVATVDTEATITLDTDTNKTIIDQTETDAVFGRF